jgi:hypothetical protein
VNFLLGAVVGGCALGDKTLVEVGAHRHEDASRLSWMGHANSKTTQLYAHYQPSDQVADAVVRVRAITSPVGVCDQRLDPGSVRADEITRRVPYKRRRAVDVPRRRLDIAVLDSRPSGLGSHQPAA